MLSYREVSTSSGSLSNQPSFEQISPDRCICYSWRVLSDVCAVSNAFLLEPPRSFIPGITAGGIENVAVNVTRLQSP